MRALVTGAAGFIGAHLVERLVADGFEVVATDIVMPALSWRQKAWRSAHERILHDLRYGPLDNMFADVDWVFHLAADVGGVGYLAANDYRPYFNNTRMSLNVLEAAERQGVRRLFYASSSCVYPVDMQVVGWSRPVGRCNLHEDLIEEGEPDLMYGREKLMTLRLCERAPFDARVGIFNTIFGPGLKLEGERMKYPAAVTVRAIEAAKTGAALDIWGDGTQVRGYLHVGDAVNKIMTIMREPYEGPVNVTSKEVASCNDVARMVMHLLGTDLKVNHIDGPTGPAYRHVSNEKWERTYGLDPQRTMVEAFADFVPWVASTLGTGV